MRRPRLLAVAALTVALAAFPLGTLASHNFADVPDSNPFHADISALAASGVTTGCGGGNYCPSANVTREQMAAFMNRLGALQDGKTPVVNADKVDGLDSSQFARSDTLHTGFYSCHGSATVPVTGSTDYTTSGGRSAVNGGGDFGCELILPNESTIVAFRAFVSDTSTTEAVGPCVLNRITLADATQALLADVASTGAVAIPGAVTLTDLTIFSPIVDTSAFAYSMACTIDGTGSDVTFAGMQAEYTVTGVHYP